MAVHTSSNQFNDTDEYDEEIDETEEDLIENYFYLTRRCGIMKQSSTSDALHSIEKETRRTKNTAILARQFSLMNDCSADKYRVGLPSSKACSSLNNFKNLRPSDYSSSVSRIPPTIYYNISEDDDEDYSGRPFSLVKLFARMKARLKHDRRYRPNSTHQLLCEEDAPDWAELTKNTRQILTKALLPDGGYDALRRNHRSRRNSQKKSRDSDPVLGEDVEEDNEKISFDFDDTFGAENDRDYDEMIWERFLTSPRGYPYRRCAVCKAIDRQEYQGQLVYVYGVANNIIIDENLKASGLG